MKPRAVTFDAAGTLVRVRWNPGRLAVQCAQAAGIDIEREQAASDYHSMLVDRRIEFEGINLLRDEQMTNTFWLSLTRDWLAGLGQPASLAPKVIEEADEALYGPNSEVFQLYEDVLPALASLERREVKMAVISNWDSSLHRVLRSKGIHHRFSIVTASLEEGIEKPDPRLFHFTLDRLGVPPAEAAHVGDDPIDDFEGAKSAGMDSIWLDRNRPDVCGRMIPSLSELPGVLGWTD